MGSAFVEVFSILVHPHLRHAPVVLKTDTTYFTYHNNDLRFLTLSITGYTKKIAAHPCLSLLRIYNGYNVAVNHTKYMTYNS